MGEVTPSRSHRIRHPRVTTSRESPTRVLGRVRTETGRTSVAAREADGVQRKVTQTKGPDSVSPVFVPQR